MSAPTVVVAFAFVVFCAHVSLFALGAPPTPGEVNITGAAYDGTLFQAVLTGWSWVFGSDQLAQRLLSVTCAILAFWFLFAALEARTGQPLVSAALLLGLAIFPPAVFAFATINTASAALLISLIGSWLVTRDVARPWMTGGALGLIIASLPFVDIAGAALGAALVVFALFERRPPLFWGALAAVAFVSTGLASQFIAFALPIVTEADLDQSIVRSYAMLWVTLSVSVLALALSPTLRTLMGTDAVRRATAALAAVFATSIWLGLSYVTVGTVVGQSIPALLGLGLIASAPFALWIRLVMPKIRSVWIWILLPVLMYCCFWVVLSGIDLAADPYANLTF